jgi:chromosome segregation ATPase
VQVRLQNALSAANSDCAKRTEELAACKSEVDSLRRELQSTRASQQKHLQQVGSLRASLQAASAELQAAGLEAPEPCRESGFSLMLMREKEQLVLRLDHEVQGLHSELRQAKQESARARAQMRHERMQATLREEQLLEELQRLEADAEEQVPHDGLMQACFEWMSTRTDEFYARR